MKIDKVKNYNSEIIDEILSEISPDEYQLVEKKMLLAAKIDEAIKARGWQKQDLAKALRKRPSEISKWLSGTHNFTIETLWEIEKVLNVELINLHEKKPEETIVRYKPVIIEKIVEKWPFDQIFSFIGSDYTSDIVTESNNNKYAKKGKTIKGYSVSVKSHRDS